ncbi:MAG TPA: hypothetical protein VN707_03795 [Casimicrobiaceae bacterium]|nr:hypothetical protein [Casimicrobiaceae bacterium]
MPSGHFARKVARENSSNVSMPSWFVSSWSKILRASASCDAFAPLVAVALLEVPFGIAPVAVDEGAAGVAGAVVAGVDVLDDDPPVSVAPVDEGVDCASLVPAFDDADVVSEVVAQAVPAMVMMAAAHAVTSCRCKAFMGVLSNGRRLRAPPMTSSLMQGTCRATTR